MFGLGAVLARWALVKTLLLLAVAAAAATTGLGMSALRTGVAPRVRIGRAFAITRSEHDLQLDDLVPLCVGALLFRDGEQRLQALPR